MREQNKCYEALLVKLEEQKNAIVHANEARLKAIIGEKGVLIAATQELEKKIGAALKGVTESGRDKAIESVAAVRGQIESNLKKLIALESACEDILNVEKIHTQDLLKGLQQKKKGAKGYKKSGDKSGFSKEA
jgi:hypothetical protein